MTGGGQRSLPWPSGRPSSSKLLAAAIRLIYTAASARAAEAESDAFEQRSVGTEVSCCDGGLAARLEPRDAFFAFPPQIRRVIYTTNAIESINSQSRRIIKSRGYFPGAAARS